MFKSYFKVALRSFSKDRLYAIVNLSGLAIGLACVFMIMAYIMYELSYDKHYSNADRIYRLVMEIKKSTGVEQSLTGPDPLIYTLQKEFPDIEAVSELTKFTGEFAINDQQVKLNALYVDSTFLHMFNLPFIAGNETALKDNFNIVLTAAAAQRLFPKQNPVGAVIYSSDKKRAYKITGLINNIPGNTHFTGDAIVTKMHKPSALNWHGFYSSGSNYIMLKPGVNPNAFLAKLPAIFNKYDFPKEISFVLQPVTSIHLHSNIPDEPFQNNSMKNIYIFLFIALLILITACINYINLTTARSLQRVKEVGVRKVLGADKKKLAFQFIIESVLFFIVSLPFAFLIAGVLWPLFTRAIDINAGLGYLLNAKFLIISIIVAIITGALAGLYPAYIAARLKPVYILKGWQAKGIISFNIRKVLIVFQFVISVVLIISTLVAYAQLHLLNNMDLGFNKQNLIMLPYQKFEKNVAAYKQQLKLDKSVSDVSLSGFDIGDRYGPSSSQDAEDDSTKLWEFAFLDADFDFLKTTQAKLVAGRDVSYQHGADLVDVDSLLSGKKYETTEWMNAHSKTPLIITETTAKNLHLKNPAGSVLKYGALQGTVIGVVKDFNGISLLKKPTMVIIRESPRVSWGNTYIRIAPGNTTQTISHIEKVWKQFFPGQAFEFSFVDDRLQALYTSQQKLAGIFNAFAILAIIIASLGLFSLLAITVHQRTKEIGIRKVLGASVMQIVQLLSSGFIKLVIIAIIIATPLGWWLMNMWLQDYAFRITIGWWVFATAGSVAVVIALAAISSRAFKAAGANPADSLRTE